MYPGTIFTIDDQSDIVSLPISETVAQPIEFMVFTADKGTEDYIYVQGNNFFEQYGNNISFEKHGQPLLQAANVINSGGKLFCKRVVAADSKLANNGIVGTIATKEQQKVNDEGKKLYWNADKSQQVPEDDPTADLENPVMIKVVSLSYNLLSMENLTNNLEAGAQAFNAAASTTNSYPLFFMADSGRGVSAKRVIIAPDYAMSRSYEYLKYNITIVENNDTLSSLIASLNPSIIEGTSNIGFDNVIKNTNVPQIRSKFFDTNFEVFVEKIKEQLVIAISANMVQDDPTLTPEQATEMATAQVATLNIEFQDLLFGKNYKGETIVPELVISDETQLSQEYGAELQNGDNGNFGDKPFAPEKRVIYETEMVKAFDGTFDDCIYDVNNNPMHLVIDANYPMNVKMAIAKLASFREDICFFLDVCNFDTDTRVNSPCRSVEELRYVSYKFKDFRTRYVLPYCTWYDIIDPYTRKQVNVSIGYSLARLVVKHFTNGRTRPLAGMKYGMTIPEAIEGTVNFVPKITPAKNQKTEMEELRINYACFLQNQFVIETEFTFQEHYTDLSFANNVFAIQEIIQAVRAACPLARYSFTDGEDFEDYKLAVQSVLNDYSKNFLSLTMEYVEDAAYINNKIFYAVIKVKFRQFVQTEIFKITALPYVMSE